MSVDHFGDCVKLQANPHPFDTCNCRERWREIKRTEKFWRNQIAEELLDCSCEGNIWCDLNDKNFDCRCKCHYYAGLILERETEINE